MKFDIKDLFTELDPKNYKDIGIHNNTDISPNFDDIKNGVLKSINRNNSNDKKSNDKKKRFKRTFSGVWAAALIISLTVTTVFAFSNIEFFKEIFGKEIEKMGEDIQTVIASTENKDYIFTVESLLTDGSQNYFILSLEKKNKEDIGEIKPDIRLRMIKSPGEESEQTGSLAVSSIEKIESFDTKKNKGYYLLKYNTTDNLIEGNIELSLIGIYEEDLKKRITFDEKLSVSFDIVKNNSLKTLKMGEVKDLDDKYRILEVKYSNLGMNIIGEYIEDIDGIPEVEVKIKYKDGSIKEISREVLDKDEFGFAYHRDLDKFQNMITFNKPIYFDEVESIIIEEKEYKIK